VITALPYHQAHEIEEQYRGRLWRTDRRGSIKVIRTWLLVRGDKRDVGKRFVAYATFNVTSTLAALCIGRQDVVITPSPPLTIGLSGWLLAAFWRAAFIYNVQDIYPDAAIKLGLLRNACAVRFFEWLERFVYARADAVTVLSDDFKHNLLAKRVAADKVVLIPNPVDTEFLRPCERENNFAVRNDLVGRFVVLYAGNVGLAQGVETLVDATALVTIPGILVLVVGAGAELGQVRARAEAQLHDDRMRFLPFQPRDEVPLLYASADAAVVLLRVGMGNTSTPSKLFTIMAMGKPVIASVDRETEVWRLVESVGCGVCVPPDDPRALAEAIDALAAAPDRAQAMGAKGRAHAEQHYGRRGVGDQYHELVGKLRGQD